MSTTWAEINPWLVCLLAAGVCAVGVRGLWAGRLGGAWHLADNAAALLVVAAAALAAWERPALVWVPLGVLGGAAVLTRVVAVSAWPRARAAGPLLAGPALALASFATPAAPPPTDLIPPRQIPLEQRLYPAADAHAVTDRGRQLALFRVAAANEFPEPLRESEVHDLRDRAEHLLRTAGPDEASNCHGWVFTGGAYWVPPENVPHILEENGYAPVPAPRADDLIVYRSPEGGVEHTGVVRTVTRDGLVLVESKWGVVGRFVHTPDASPYGTRHTFYRSARPGHALALQFSPPPASRDREPLSED